MTNAEVLRVKIKQYRKESGYDNMTAEERKDEARKHIEAMRKIRASNKGLDLIGSYMEIRKGYR